MGQVQAKQKGGCEHKLVKKLTGLVSLKGEDLLLQPQTEDVVKYHRLRASVPARLWKWRVAASWEWRGGREHINVCWKCERFSTPFDGDWSAKANFRSSSSTW